MIIAWIGFGISFVLASILSGNGIGATWTWIFVPIMLVVAIVLLKIGNKKYNSLMKQLKEDNKKQKLDNLRSALNSKGYENLTSEELNHFE